MSALLAGGGRVQAHETAGVALPADRDRYLNALRQGEAALARANLAQALEGFERAASVRHAVEAELGLVRTYLQAGEFRRAIGFCAHTAGAHRDEPAGSLMYACLLRMAGQHAAAGRLIDEASRRWPGDGRVRAMLQAAGTKALRVDATQLALPARLAPYSTLAGVSAGSLVRSTAVLIGDGTHALVPSSVVRGRRGWVRNGLGQGASARMLRRLEPTGLSLLALDRPLPQGAMGALATTEAFPGSPAFCVHYEAPVGALPAWPVLRAGFAGASSGGDRFRRVLAIELPDGPPGGLVCDARGRVTGIAVKGAQGACLQVSIVEAMREVPLPVTMQPGSSSDQKLSTDEIYEHAMRTAVQWIEPR